MHNTRNIDTLAFALIDLVSCMNSPRQDDVLLREAGVSLDRALFPLLIRVDKATSIGVAELAEQVGRDPSTVSRQIAKLEELGLVARQPGREDMRVREATITKAGSRTIHAITSARRLLLDQLLHGWTNEEREQLPRLLRKFADAMKDRQKIEFAKEDSDAISFTAASASRTDRGRRKTRTASFPGRARSPRAQ